MKTKFLNSAILLACVVFLSSCKHQTSSPNTTFTFDLQELSSQNGISKISNSAIFNSEVLQLQVNQENNQLIISDGSDSKNWKDSKYFVCDIYHANDYSAIIYIDFYRKVKGTDEGLIVQQGGQSITDPLEKPRISPKMGILPQVKTRLIFPLEYLDGQQIFMQRFPRQLKGTVMGRRLDPSDIGKVVMRIEPVSAPDFLPELEIAAMFLTDSIPQPLEKLTAPVVDEFGQWTMKDWKGKIKSEDDLKAGMLNLESSAGNSSFPDDWSIYGGWKQKKFKATGFFRTHNDGKRWWLVDPDGYAFLSAGIDCIRNNVEGVVSGQEDMFKWLPDQNDSLFSDAYRKRGQDMIQFDFLKSNLMRVYGKEWKMKWEEITAGLLRQWSVNTIANWSDLEFAKNAKLPYVLNMSRFPTSETLIYRDFPDVFSDQYAANCIEFARQLEPVKNDRYLIGYFLSNEPHWAFGDNNLAFEMFATNTSSATRNKMGEWLKEKYNNNITLFNEAWKLNLTDFDNLNQLVMKDSPSDACWNDCNEFSGIMVDQYIKQVCDEVKKVDNNHLNLGMRYAWISSELCYRAGAWFDVFSINGYSYPGPPETAEIAKRSGKPVIIGEYHFGSIDRGLPANGIQGAENQQARGEAYRYYLEQGFTRPELIGIHYFQWMDQPVFGRFDGENYNIGFLDICMNPYTELTDQAKISHERMYKVASGEEKPFDKIIRKMPQIFF